LTRLGVHGSSPRARGTGMGLFVAVQRRRFIPARAGNGQPDRVRRGHDPVHPRARGERPCFTATSGRPCGSSPRARGTVFWPVARVAVGRFIPARAGNGPCAALNHASEPVHPRARGERVAGAVAGVALIGSSPRARGTGDVSGGDADHLRFIPARAGNGSTLAPQRIDVTVHPRARGERGGILARCSRSSGSSPRARGTGDAVYCNRCSWRFIPARAGNGRLPVGSLHF